MVSLLKTMFQFPPDIIQCPLTAPSFAKKSRDISEVRGSLGPCLGVGAPHRHPCEGELTISIHGVTKRAGKED